MMSGPVSELMVGESRSSVVDAASSDPLLDPLLPAASSGYDDDDVVSASVLGNMHVFPEQSSASAATGSQEVLVGVSRRGQPKLFIGSYSYVQSRSRHFVAPSEANSWRCYKMHCRGRVVKVNGNFVLRHPHTCDCELTGEVGDSPSGMQYQHPPL